MPKLPLSKEEKQNRIVAGAIENQLTIINMSKPELAKKTGIPYSTLALRIRNPSTFSLADLRKVFIAIRMPQAEKERLARECM